MRRRARFEKIDISTCKGGPESTHPGPEPEPATELNSQQCLNTPLRDHDAPSTKGHTYRGSVGHMIPHSVSFGILSGICPELALL
jgi:hypothetical protein